jgi:hypothetical protein
MPHQLIADLQFQVVMCVSQPCCWGIGGAGASALLSISVSRGFAGHPIPCNRGRPGQAGSGSWSACVGGPSLESLMLPEAKRPIRQMHDNRPCYFMTCLPLFSVAFCTGLGGLAEQVQFAGRARASSRSTVAVRKTKQKKERKRDSSLS